MVSYELALLAEMQIEQMNIDPLSDSPDGSYYIAIATIGATSTADRFLNILMQRLSEKYPMYEWKRSSDFFQPGTLVSWRKLGKTLER